MKPQKHVCSECFKERERCRVYTQDREGNLVYVCRQCWRDLEFDKYLYEHKQLQEKNA